MLVSLHCKKKELLACSHVTDTRVNVTSWTTTMPLCNYDIKISSKAYSVEYLCAARKQCSVCFVEQYKLIIYVSCTYWLSRLMYKGIMCMYPTSLIMNVAQGSQDTQPMADFASWFMNTGSAADGLHNKVSGVFFWSWNANSGVTISWNVTTLLRSSALTQLWHACCKRYQTKNAWTLQQRCRLKDTIDVLLYAHATWNPILW